ncbi:MAG: hypothetical protein ABGZ35_26570, partial [Planctomycetaceae bacterium]
GDDPVFSGPQVGEKLPPFSVNSVLGETAGHEIDLVKRADGKPVLLAFVHARTRPGFGLTNMLMRYAASRASDGLQSGVVFLTVDSTKTAQWMKVVEKHLSSENVVYGISPEGQEGPGSYGLNRNMTLTVIVGHEGKVSANFALVQPSVQSDGPKILKAIVDAMGGGKVPTIAELGGARYQNADRKMMKSRDGKNDPKLAALMRTVIQKDAADKDVEKAAAQVDEYVKKNEAARRQLGEIAARIVKSGRLSNYGTKSAQEAIGKWAKLDATPSKAGADDSKPKKNPEN